jgi:DUF3052 family protein
LRHRAAGPPTAQADLVTVWKGIVMGDVLECRAQFNKQTSDGKALLETEELIFRGDFRVKALLKDLKSVTAKDGKLKVVWPEGTLILELGPRAEKWAHKILNPKSVIDKLGVKADQRVSLVGFDDGSFLNELKDRGVEVSGGRPKNESDAIFLVANDLKALEKIEGLKAFIKKDGAIWVLAPKGGNGMVKEMDVLNKGREAGLVDVKVVSFSAIYTAHKFVIPVALR